MVKSARLNPEMQHFESHLSPCPRHQDEEEEKEDFAS